MTQDSPRTFFKILKFGGSSLSSAKQLESVRQIIENERTRHGEVVIVVSALAGCTDMLLEMGRLAPAGDHAYEQLFDQFAALHRELAEEALSASSRAALLMVIDVLLHDLKQVLYGVSLVRDISARTVDLVASFGERLSSCLVCEFLRQTIPSIRLIDAREVLVTDANFGNAAVDVEATRARLESAFIGLNGPAVVTGYIGATRDKETTTLGRGGSDYTAALLGSLLEVDEIQLWTTVDGVMTADPNKVKKAFTIPFLSYEEAMEICHFGARIIYPRSIQPAMDANIPLRIRNSLTPEKPGTLISARIASSNFAITGISSINEVALLRLEGSGMVGVAGVARRLFDALAHESISVILISQASSEHSICFAVSPTVKERAREVIEREFALEIQTRRISPLRVETRHSVIAVVGANMRHSPGIAGKVFQALGKNGINVSAIAQGSSELNISMVVDSSDESKALNALHDAFFLSGAKTVHLFLMGTGQVGRTLLEQLRTQQERFLRRKLEFKLVGVANSRRMLLSEQGIPLQARDALEAQGRPTNVNEFIQRMKATNLPNSIFVDCTASGDVASLYGEVLRASISIVTPNKRANSAGHEEYVSLRQYAERANVKFFYETNVGAGLPVIGTLNDLMQSGDELIRIEAVLSGTLSYIFNTFAAGSRFSEVVSEAKRLGYTEPDPRDDLSGTDVARKLLILGREAGLELELDDIEVESLVPPACRDAADPESFLRELARFDDEFEARASAAAREGQVLRYIGGIAAGRASVKLVPVGPEHPFYSLSGSDNIISFTTKRYFDRPLVVKGPGAGTDVTAAGVLADIVRAAGYLS